MKELKDVGAVAPCQEDEGAGDAGVRLMYTSPDELPDGLAYVRSRLGTRHRPVELDQLEAECNTRVTSGGTCL